MDSISCGFIGLGLIGGSILKALKAANPNARIVAYDKNTVSLELAKSQGYVDEISDCIGDAFHGLTYIFLCAPVSFNDENLAALKPLLSPDTIITDVGSVKTDIHEHVKALGLEKQFIGGHPMAGSEKTGFENSAQRLLENAYYVLTPSPDVPSEKTAQFHALLASLGAIPLELSYEQHDYVTAAISHLPHVVSATLVNLVKKSDSADGIMKLIAAGGFKDITRISSSSPVMWQNICLANTANISKLLQDYIEALTAIKAEIDTGNGDALYSFFDTARNYRDSFGNASSGPIKKLYFFYLDITDKAGALSQVVSLLAEEKLSIKNIGIIHNREFEEGVLRIEFYEEDIMEKACTLLQKRHYTVHRK
ncbi:MAG: prephenate dehydrogenase [Lachnospiraceae bacterium]|nr:prephenate dehydrogenase [Lachnospiraceae bacterium]